VKCLKYCRKRQKRGDWEHRQPTQNVTRVQLIEGGTLFCEILRVLPGVLAWIVRDYLNWCDVCQCEVVPVPQGACLVCEPPDTQSWQFGSCKHILPNEGEYWHRVVFREEQDLAFLREVARWATHVALRDHNRKKSRVAENIRIFQKGTVRFLQYEQDPAEMPPTITFFVRPDTNVGIDLRKKRKRW
jgi:hypothetical protein